MVTGSYKFSRWHFRWRCLLKKWALGSSPNEKKKKTTPGGLAPKPCPVDEPPVVGRSLGWRLQPLPGSWGMIFCCNQKKYPSLKVTQFFLRNDVKESINMSRNHVVSKQRNLQPKKRYFFEKTFCCPFVPFDRFLELGPFLGQAKLLDLSSDQNPG